MIDASRLQDLITGAMSARLDELYTAIPGRVVSYDPATQTATIQPQITRVVYDSDGSTQTETLPDIPAVPIMYPRTAVWQMHLPLSPGDGGLLICGHRDPSDWLRTGVVSPPADLRTHALAHATFVPGLFPSAERMFTGLVQDAFHGRVDGPLVIYPAGDAVEVRYATGVAEPVALAPQIATTVVLSGAQVALQAMVTALGSPTPPLVPLVPLLPTLQALLTLVTDLGTSSNYDSTTLSAQP